MSKKTPLHRWASTSNQLEQLLMERLPRRAARPAAEIAATLLIHYPDLRGGQSITVGEALDAAIAILHTLLDENDPLQRSLLKEPA
jgi:hypothetical protein